MNVTIRQATRDDAATIEKLEREFADYLISIEDTNPQWLSAETYLKEAFGADPAFSGLVGLCLNGRKWIILSDPIKLWDILRHRSF